MSKASIDNKNSLYTSSYFLINTQNFNNSSTMMDFNTKMNTTTSCQKGDMDFISRRNNTMVKPGTYNNASIVEDNYQL